MDVYHDILKKYWGFNEFRPLQKDIIYAISQKKDTLGLMPTGGGKSLTFQVPTMAMEGLCIVVTPLIALMKDQVDNLRQRDIKALAIYSGMARQEILTTLDNAIHGNFKFLYVSPERLHTELFLKKLQYMNVCLLVVDESHCISQWGYDFRPSYLKIADIRTHIPEVPVLALTATATAQVAKDIQERLHFKEENIFKMSYVRNNLTYLVHKTENKPEKLVNILTRIDGSTIIYVRSRKRTKEISDFLVGQGLSSDFYHAGLPAESKIKKQNAWKENHSRIIVSTNAFGMGIDKPDVCLVIHIDLPNSIEEYFQEAGRAGRDGQRAYAIILYTKTDATKLNKRINNEFPDREFIKKVYESLAFYYQIAEGYGIGTTRDFDIMQFCSVYKLPIIGVHSALRMLDLSGYIEYIDEVNNRSRLMFTIYRDDLYNYGFEEGYEQLINVILRLYTGLFANYAAINETEIAQRLNKSRSEIYDMLVFLDRRKILDYIPHKKLPLISYLLPRMDKKYVSIPQSVYEERKMRFEKRIKAMTDYVETNDICRSRMLVSYFGEQTVQNCEQCDVCKTKKEAGLNNIEYDSIAAHIRKLITDEAKEINFIIASLSNYAESDIHKSIRFLIDIGDLGIDLEKIYRRKK